MGYANCAVYFLGGESVASINFSRGLTLPKRPLLNNVPPSIVFCLLLDPDHNWVDL